MPRYTKSDSTEITYQKILTSHEIPFVAYCRTKYRLPLIDIKKASTGRVAWTLELKDKDENTLFQEFHQGAVVPANEYFLELKNLKSTTYGV